MKRLGFIFLLLASIAWGADFAFNRNLSIQQENTVLPVDQAFHLENIHLKDNLITLTWNITEGYYLYRDKMVLSAHGINLQTPQWPTGAQIKDEMFGTQTVYYHKLVLPMAFINSQNNNNATLTVTYQGCQEKGVCFPPVTHTFTFDPTFQTPSAPAPVPDPQTQPAPQAALDRFFLTTQHSAS